MGGRGAGRGEWKRKHFSVRYIYSGGEETLVSFLYSKYFWKTPHIHHMLRNNFGDEHGSVKTFREFAYKVPRTCWLSAITTYMSVQFGYACYDHINI
jgi:hypothetical protein